MKPPINTSFQRYFAPMQSLMLSCTLILSCGCGASKPEVEELKSKLVQADSSRAEAEARLQHQIQEMRAALDKNVSEVTRAKERISDFSKQVESIDRSLESIRAEVFASRTDVKRELDRMDQSLQQISAQSAKTLDLHAKQKDEQKLVSVRAAVANLRKISSATAVGINRGDYSRLVTEISSSVEAGIAAVNDDALAELLRKLLTSHLVVARTWNQMSGRFGQSAVLSGQEASEFSKLFPGIGKSGVISDFYLPLCWDVTDALMKSIDKQMADLR